MKGMMASLLGFVCATGMVVAQQTNNSTTQTDGPPLLYDLPVTDSLLDGIKREGWRQATLEPEVRGRVYEIVFRNPMSNSAMEPDVIYNANGIRNRSLYFVVNDQQLETMRTRGLKYRVKRDEVKQFDSIVLVYESPYPTVPMSPEMARGQSAPQTNSNLTGSSGSPGVGSSPQGANQPSFNSSAGSQSSRTDSTVFAGGASSNNSFPTGNSTPASNWPNDSPSTDWQTRPSNVNQATGGGRATGNSYLDNLPERNPPQNATANGNAFRPRFQAPSTNNAANQPGVRLPTLLEMQQANEDYRNQLAQEEAARRQQARQQEQIEQERRLAAKEQQLAEQAAWLAQEQERLRRQQANAANTTSFPDDSRSTLNHPTYRYPPRYGDASFAGVTTGGQDISTGPPTRTRLTPVTDTTWPTNPRVADAGNAAGQGTVAATAPTGVIQLLAKNGIDDEEKLAATLEQHKELLAQVERMRQLQKTNGFLWFMLLFAIGLCVYLSWIARGFYVRYAELADELRETFTSSLS